MNDLVYWRNYRVPHLASKEILKEAPKYQKLDVNSLKSNQKFKN
jgi:hypothetical protein